MRNALYRHIVLSGGSSKFPGMENRIEKEMKNLYCQEVLNGDSSLLRKSMIIRMTFNDFYIRPGVFRGGSVLADIMKDRPEFWMSKADYQELGIKQLLARARGGKN